MTRRSVEVEKRTISRLGGQGKWSVRDRSFSSLCKCGSASNIPGFPKIKS